MISKRTSTTLVQEMTACDLEEAASNVVKECKKQWEQRKRRTGVSRKGRVEKKTNLLRGVPKSWCELLKTQLTPCPACIGLRRIC